MNTIMSAKGGSASRSGSETLQGRMTGGKKYLLIAIPVLLLAAACGKQAQVQPAQPAPQPQAQIQPIDEMANWKTYTNSQYGFEFKYPSAYKLETVGKSQVAGNLLKINLHETSREMPEGTPGIGVGVWNNSKHLSLLDWAKVNSSYSNYSAASLNTDYKEGMLLGQKTFSYSWQGLGYGKTVLVQVSADKLLLLDVFSTNQDDGIWLTFENIVASLKFTNDETAKGSTSPTTGWKTYTNEDLGFTIQYPSSWTADAGIGEVFEVIFHNGGLENHISIVVQPYGKTLNDWIKDLDQSVITSKKNITIGGQQGTEFYTGEMGGLKGTASVVYKGNVYVFYEVDSMIQSGMLKSFKFTK